MYVSLQGLCKYLIFHLVSKTEKLDPLRYWAVDPSLQLKNVKSENLLYGYSRFLRFPMFTIAEIQENVSLQDCF